MRGTARCCGVGRSAERICWSNSSGGRSRIAKVIGGTLEMRVAGWRGEGGVTTQFDWHAVLGARDAFEVGLQQGQQVFIPIGQATAF